MLGMYFLVLRYFAFVRQSSRTDTKAHFNSWRKSKVKDVFLFI